MKLREIVEKHGGLFVCNVEAELRKLAEEKPEFIYRPMPPQGVYVYAVCSYNGPSRTKVGGENIGPECSGCIFGQAFQRLGWDDPIEMSQLLPISALLDVCILGKFRRDKLPLPNFSCPYRWIEVQNAQDKGCSWSAAIAKLERASAQ